MYYEAMLMLMLTPGLLPLRLYDRMLMLSPGIATVAAYGCLMRLDIMTIVCWLSECVSITFWLYAVISPI